MYELPHDESTQTAAGALSEALARIAELERCVALAVAICDVEQLHKHDPGAPVPAIHAAYALRPDLYEQPSGWADVIAEVHHVHPAIRKSSLDEVCEGYAGWRPPARVIETVEELDAIDWPCAVREITPTGELEFFPEIWESPFQTDGWNRYGRLFDEADCTPRLPVEVLPEPMGGNR